MRLASWVIAAVVLAGLSPARADDEATRPSYRVVIDRVDLEPSSLTGQRLRIDLSALTLQGQQIDLTDPKSIKVLAGTSELKAPYALGAYGDTGAATAIVIVVQATAEYGEVLPVITETLDGSVLANLDEHTQVAILSYGENTGTGKLGTLKAARGKLTSLGNDGSAGEPALLDTLDRAVQLLKKAKTEPEGRPLRKMIILIGDGRDRAGDHERVTRLGVRAAKEGIRIHSFAYSAADLRRPLLLLGELSKRSLGTFRWVQRPKADSWTPAFEQLSGEITKQYVLTYFLGPDDEVAGKKLKVKTVGRIEATSNEMKVPESSCGGEPCEAGYCTSGRCVVPLAPEPRGVVGWVVLIGGLGLGAIVLLGVIGFVITKRSEASREWVPPPGFIPPPGFVPPGRKAKQVKPAVAAPGMPPGMAVPVAAAASRPVPHLLIVNGPRAGERVALRHGFMIGKVAGCDLLIDDGYTSSHHAQVMVDPAGNCRLFDYGSTNGTFVNGVRITDHPLEHGASIRIGSTELRFLTQ